MSEADVQVLREMYEAFNDGDARRAATYLHAEAELDQAAEIPDADTYRGKAEVQRGLGLWLEEWEEFRFEPERIVPGQDRIFIQVRLLGRAKRSGVESERIAFHVWTIRDGKAFRCEAYLDRGKALEAAGIQD